MIVGVVEPCEGELEQGETRLRWLLSGVQCPAAVALLLRSRQTGCWAKLSGFVTECELGAAAAEGEMGAG